jgi:hypothetical protein
MSTYVSEGGFRRNRVGRVALSRGTNTVFFFVSVGSRHYALGVARRFPFRLFVSVTPASA